MSVVLPVERITPQTLRAVQVAMGENGQIAGVIAALLAELTLKGYETESLTGPQYIGGWRIKLTYAGEVDQFAGPPAGPRIFGTLAQFETEAGSHPILLNRHEGLIVAHLTGGNGACDSLSVRLYALNRDTCQFDNVRP